LKRKKIYRRRRRRRRRRREERAEYKKKEKERKTYDERGKRYHGRMAYPFVAFMRKIEHTTTHHLFFVDHGTTSERKQV